MTIKRYAIDGNRVRRTILAAWKGGRVICIEQKINLLYASIKVKPVTLADVTGVQ
jgi:hypothetical protein